MILILGGGISGLSLGTVIESVGRDRVKLLESTERVGGYCKTSNCNGFVWDRSGHFFHFNTNEVEEYFKSRMGGADVSLVEKKTVIYYNGKIIDFPFQKISTSWIKMNISSV